MNELNEIEKRRAVIYAGHDLFEIDCFGFVEPKTNADEPKEELSLIGNVFYLVRLFVFWLTAVSIITIIFR